LAGQLEQKSLESNPAAPFGFDRPQLITDAFPTFRIILVSQNLSRKIKAIVKKHNWEIANLYKMIRIGRSTWFHKIRILLPTTSNPKIHTMADPFPVAMEW